MKKLYDKKGIEIKEYDILKVYHFTGPRRKKYYMYKQVSILAGELFGMHLGYLSIDESRGYLLANPKSNILKDTEIVQEGKYEFEPREKINV